MDMFDEINKNKKDLPKFDNIGSKVLKYKYNFYQLFAISLFIISIVIGIVFGNLFSTCGTSSAIYYGTCASRQFNFGLMLSIWFIGFIICVFFFAIGHIISLLSKITNLLKK